MDKTINEKVTVNHKTHQFYCDRCDKFLGESEEYDDGWYERFGEFDLSFYLPGISNKNSGNEYKINMNLCDNCKFKFLSNLDKCLVDNFGFKRKEH